MDDLILNTYKLLKEIKSRQADCFSGIGLVVYDKDSFDEANHCDLRPGVKPPFYNISDNEISNYLIDIADYHHSLHDGFHLIDHHGVLRHVAQYFVPPVVKELMPNQEHGVRLYSSLCGSIMKGVLFIGVISSDYRIYMFQSGKYIKINELEEKINNGYK